MHVPAEVPGQATAVAARRPQPDHENAALDRAAFSVERGCVEVFKQVARSEAVGSMSPGTSS